MKKPFLGLRVLAAWLVSFAAHATTYTYDVDYGGLERQRYEA